MSNKRDLHTLFLKHDTDFGTLSKKALSEVILKIIFFQSGGTKLSQIKTELATVISGSISDAMIEESLKVLTKSNKLTTKRGKFLIHPNISASLEKSANENNAVQERIFEKYLHGTQTENKILRSWFKDTLILFFENFSMEWFNHLTQNGKFSPKKFDNNILSAIEDVLIKYDDNLIKAEIPFLKNQFIKFYESDEMDENNMFWNFGMSLFSSRLITARNYADKVSIETYKNGCFILDTNILMILDLEAHELVQSFVALDKIFSQLNIKIRYFHITADEYKRAIAGRKADTIHVFESFDIEVLKTTKCPFVQTALERGCITTSDVERMFDTLYDIPKVISEYSSIEMIDYPELEAEIIKGATDEQLKSKIEDIYFKRLKKNKRENPKVHDAGMIHGINFLRRTEPAWILTTDGTIKVYAIENIVRDETEIAIGLDTLIGMFAVNDGGVDVDSSDFAPLFKNLIKHSLIPQENIFDVRDLAFILSTNLRINDLENEKVVEIAGQVRRMRVAGNEDEEISLFLRREIEGQKLGIVKDLSNAKASEGIAKMEKEKAEKERDNAYEQIRIKRRGELRDQYDKNLIRNRVYLLCIPLVFSLTIFLTLRYGLESDTKTQYLVGCSVEFIFGLLPFFPINKRLIRRHSEYISGIDHRVELEILETKKNNQ